MGVDNNLAIDEPVLDLPALAYIVRDLITGDPSWRQADAWLQERIAAVGPSDYACAALTALRRKLSEPGSSLLSATALLNWS